MLRFMYFGFMYLNSCLQVSMTDVKEKLEIVVQENERYLASFGAQYNATGNYSQHFTFSIFYVIASFQIGIN